MCEQVVCVCESVVCEQVVCGQVVCVCARPATQSEGGCRQVPRLPRKTPRRHGVTPKTKRATRASPVP